jgi:hypothetical protein
MTPVRSRQSIVQQLLRDAIPARAEQRLRSAAQIGRREFGFDGGRRREVAPAEACGRAVHCLLELDAATAAVEHRLFDLRGDPGAGSRAETVSAKLVFLGCAALESHAVRYGYDPGRRLASTQIYMRTQLEQLDWFLAAGAARRCLQPMVAAIVDAVAAAILVSHDDPAFVDGVTTWTGVSLALFAVARAASD